MADTIMASVGELAAASRVAHHEVIAQVLKEAQPYIEALRGRTIVIKLGGSTLENQRDALEDIVWLRGLGARPVLVHGGGPDINGWLERLGIAHRFARGLRVTDAATLEVVRMVLIGKVNSELVGLIGQLGGQAVGISGVDGQLLRATPIAPELGYVGSVTSVNPGPIEVLSAAGYIPVIAPLALGPDDAVLNVNADDAAADLARGLGAAKLLYLSNIPGILDQNGDLLSVLTDGDVRALIADGVISGGMIPKAEACLRALETTARVHIVDGREPHVLIRELFTHAGAGTMIERAS
ncbi:MAG: N-acetylglutamate kinase [Ktedonobacterales bacterium]|jgi:acetylglutamate kinase|nr:MAG: N-acetylglutamate kinase [Ktedonobacterales bacterium]